MKNKIETKNMNKNKSKTILDSFEEKDFDFFDELDEANIVVDAKYITKDENIQSFLDSSKYNYNCSD